MERERMLGFLYDTVQYIHAVIDLDEEAMKRVIANGDKLREDFKASIIKYSKTEKRFELMKSFEITVPEDYDHETQLAAFAEYAKKEKFYYYSSNITYKNFEKATQKLVPGKTYMVKIFGIRQRVTSEDCLSFLKAQKTILVGAQGLSLVRQLKKDEFPAGRAMMSLDEKDALWEDAGGNHRVPFVYRDSGGGWKFDLGYFESDWNDGRRLLCFCDLPNG